jgi:hypothetical protein
MKAADAKKWTPSDWITKVTFAKPSGGGTVGVMFVWTTPNTTKDGKNAWDNPGTCAFVIKPLATSPGSTMMAEDLLGKVADTASPGSVAIAANTNEGTNIRVMLEKFKNKASDKTRWDEVWSHYKGAQNFLLQDMQQNMKDLSDEYRQGTKLIDLLWDKVFMSNLGMLFAADAIIGNGDRLWKVNSGNILFKPGGQIIAIDSAAILTNFEALLKAPPTRTDDPGSTRWGQHGSDNEADKTAENWAKNQVNARFTDTQIGGVAPSFSMETLWDIDNWWEKQFKGHFVMGITTGRTGATLPSDTDWQKAKTWFCAGLEEGMRRVDSMFASKSWGWLKLKFKWYCNKKKYGDDPNMDWLNLKVRRKYYKLRRAGTPEAEAQTKVLEYVTKKNNKAKKSA